MIFNQEQRKKIFFSYVKLIVCLLFLAWFFQSQFFIILFTGFLDVGIVLGLLYGLVWIFENLIKKDFSGFHSSSLGRYLKRAFFVFKFKADRLREYPVRGDRKRIAAYVFMQKVVYWLILLFQGSPHGFEIIKDHVHEISHDAARLLHKHEKTGDEYYRELFDLHKKHQKKAAIFSLSGASALAIGLIISFFVVPVIFPMNSTKAATFTWTQTSWSGGAGADTASHATNQTGWTKYSSDESNVATSTELTLKSTSNSDTSWNMTTEGNYTQQDAANGTDFGSGGVYLHSTGYGADQTAGQTAYIASTVNFMNTASAAFDNNTGFGWVSTVNNSQYVGVQFSSAKVITKVTMLGGANLFMGENDNPKNGKIEASNDGSSWTKVSVSSADGTYATVRATDEFALSNNSSNAQTVYLNNFTPYIYYRVYIYNNWGGPTFIKIAEIEMMENAYPTASAYYVTTAAASQINTAAWGPVTGITAAETTPANTTLKYLVSFDGRSNWKYWNGSAWQTSTLANIETNGMNKTTLEGISQAQWVASGGYAVGTLDFAVSLKSDSSNSSPALDQITVNYLTYPTTNNTLISSAYDTADPSNALGGVSWTQNSTLPTGAGINVYLRTATTSADLTWAAWSQVASTTAAGFLTSGCTNVSGAVSCDNSVIPSSLKTGGDDEWIQYKVELVSTFDTPTLYDITLTYVVNAPPEVRNVTAVQNSNGTVTVQYQMRDTDTDQATLAYRYKDTITLQYCTANCGSPGLETWTDASSVTGDAGADLAIGVDWSSDKTITWTPATDYAGQYVSNLKVRVRANDKESVNNYGYGTSAAFALDTKAPDLGSNPILAIGTTTPATIKLSASDDSSFNMKIGLNSDLSGASAVSYSSTSSISLATDPDTVYVQFIDAYGNSTAIQSVAVPASPRNLMVQDISNDDTGEYRLFIAWAVASAPVNKYVVYRSTDNSNFSYLAQVTDRLTNYYTDSSVASSTIYYYKVYAQDSDGNASFFSSSVSGMANGLQDAGEGGGGTDTTAPVISSVTVSATYSTMATITWDTDELADSRVDYTTASGGNFTDSSYVGVNSMLNNAAGVGVHSVTLSGLTPGTVYYFQVKSTDLYDNLGTNKQGANGYTFTTATGPIISRTTTTEVDNQTATISWTTDQEADSYVSYSTQGDLSGSTRTGSAAFTTDHTVNLTGLSAGTRYYYYVESSSAAGGTSYDKNATGGVINYYLFTTTLDSAPPIISDIAVTATSTTAVITWRTNELADSKIDYGTTTAYDLVQSDSTYTTVHAITLTGLTVNNLYHFKITSVDQNNNSASSVDETFRLNPAEITQTIYISIGGGGGGGAALDETAPAYQKIIVEPGDDETKISWNSSEPTDSVVQYGLTKSYGRLSGKLQDSTESHSIVIEDLSPSTEYHFRLACRDKAGNFGFSADSLFKTLKSGSASSTPVQSAKPEATSSPKASPSVSLSDMQSLPASDQSLITQISTFLDQLASPKSMDFANEVFQETAKRVVGPPLIAGDYPLVEVGSDWAKIKWVTDKKSNSMVAYSPAENYDPKRSEPYMIEVGDSSEQELQHSVTLTGLKPQTLYHFQARSKGGLGDPAQSGDKTFTTLSSLPEISNLRFENITETMASVAWRTNIPTRAKIDVTDVKTGAKKTVLEENFLLDHSVAIKDLGVSTDYTVRVNVLDEKGQAASSSVMAFSTTLNKEPPTISQIRISNALIMGKTDRIQTIVTWKTNKPATSRLLFREGVKAGSELNQSTLIDDSLVMDHIVVTTVFQPGKVYQLKAESVDSFENRTLSDGYTVLTPKPKESVVDLIINNFEGSFGFIKNLGF